jgi:predicted ester cyclase
VRNIDVARRAADALESRDLELLAALLADEFKATGPSLELSKEQTLAYLQVLFTAFPQHSFGFAEFEEEGDHIRCFGHEKGTHDGLLDLTAVGMPLSVPPTGRSFQLPRSEFLFRVVGDKITGFTEEVEPGGGLAGILSQLGVKPG